MRVYQRLPEVEQALEVFLLGEPSLAPHVWRDGAERLPSRLLAADVLITDGLELWYELLVSRPVADTDRIAFTLRVVSDPGLPAGVTLQVHFGEYVHAVQLDEQGHCTWTLPVDQVLERRNKRIRRPIAVSLSTPQRS
ncbi:MAG: hypothetical protein M1546_24400 [Chloroflexi bacterium]|nr:hypothetical protein [Chloroflexota bacterium]